MRKQAGGNYYSVILDNTATATGSNDSIVVIVEYLCW